MLRVCLSLAYISIGALTPMMGGAAEQDAQPACQPQANDPCGEALEQATQLHGLLKRELGASQSETQDALLLAQDLANKIQRLRSEVEQAEQRRILSEADLQHERSKTRQLDVQLQNLSQRLAEQDKKMQRLIEIAESRAAQILALENKARGLEQDLQLLEGRLSTVTLLRRELEDKLGQTETALGQAKASLAQARKDQEALRTALHSLEVSKKQLESQKERLEQEALALQASLQERQSEIEALVARIDTQLNPTITRQRQRIEDLEGENARLDGVAQGLEAQLAARDSEVSMLTRRIDDDLLPALAQEQASLAQLRAAHQQLQAALARAESQGAALTQELQAERAQTAQLQDALGGSEQSRSQLLQQLGALSESEEARRQRCVTQSEAVSARLAALLGAAQGLDHLSPSDLETSSLLPRDQRLLGNAWRVAWLRKLELAASQTAEALEAGSPDIAQLQRDMAAWIEAQGMTADALDANLSPSDCPHKLCITGEVDRNTKRLAEAIYARAPDFFPGAHLAQRRIQAIPGDLRGFLVDACTGDPDTPTNALERGF